MTPISTDQWSLKNLLADWLDGEVTQDVMITGLTLDSRRVHPGDAFVALSGGHTHGIKYIQDALSRGAVAVIVDKTVSGFDKKPDQTQVPSFEVDNLADELSAIAARFYGRPARHMAVIGVTGTDGKSSVSHYLAQALDQESAPAGIIGTLGNGLIGDLKPSGFTTPDAIGVQAALAEMADKGARWVVMEASSHGLAQGRLNAVEFNQAILTQLTRDHLDYHGSHEAYVAAKRRLFEVPGLEYAILNLDDAFGFDLFSGQITASNRIGYSLATQQSTADEQICWVRHLAVNADGFVMDVMTPWGEGRVESTLLGRFNAANLMAVLTSLLALGLALPDAIDRLRWVFPVPGRMERFEAQNAPVAIVDYAHTPGALEAVLSSLREHDSKARLSCVLGAGGERDSGKRPLMGSVAARLSDRVIVTDDNPRGEDPEAIIDEILSGMPNPDAAVIIRDRKTAVNHALDTATPGEWVLIAGKGHETVQITATGTQPYSDRETVAAWYKRLEVAS